MLLPKSFEILSKNLEILPGVGERTAERYVYYIEKKDNDEIVNLANALIKFKQTIKRCSVCNCLSDEETCPVCLDDSRNNGLLCVVEDSKTAFSIDRTNRFDGKYFVLSGLISPIDGVNPDDINLDQLIARVDSNINEIILALNPSIEGEVTSLYIQKRLEGKKVKVSRLSYGIPIGCDIEYLDPMMISKALDDRKIVS
jgi:recombination protein RecR